jgi:hypothetical protein
LSLVHHFAGLADPRLRHRRRHQLLDIIAIAICAVICGCKTWGEVALYGRNKADWLHTFLELSGGIPSKDTFRRLFARIKPTAFQACFASWMQALATRWGSSKSPSTARRPGARTTEGSGSRPCTW